MFTCEKRKEKGKLCARGEKGGCRQSEREKGRKRVLERQVHHTSRLITVQLLPPFVYCTLCKVSTED